MKGTELLDDIFIQSEPNIDLSKRMIAYIICLVGSTISFSIFNLKDIETIIGLALLLTTGLITIKYLKTGVILFSLVLFASTLDIISFFPFSFNIGFINVFMLSILFIHCYLNQDIILPVAQDAISTTKTPVNNRPTVNRFKKRFKNYSQDKLHQIVSKNQHVAEAVLAANELIEEKHS